MTALGPYLAGCLLLVVAGAAKLQNPRDTAGALVLRAGRGTLGAWATAIRAGAAAELVLGVVAALVPSPVAAAGVAASYGAFALFVADARRRGGVLSTCGCFGEPDTPPTGTHVVIDAGLALAAIAVATGTAAGGRTIPLWGLLSRQPHHGWPLVAASCMLAGLIGVALTSAARLRGVRLAAQAGASGPSTSAP